MAAYLTDDLGFPAVSCPRCGGTGSLARFHAVHHGVCFTCLGGGVVYPTVRARKEATAARQMLRDAADVGRTEEHGAHDRATGTVTSDPIELKPGMVVRPQQYQRGPDGERVSVAHWQTVATVRRGAQITGGSLLVVGHAGMDHDGRFAARSEQDWWVETIVTFTDGTHARIGSENWEAKPGDDVLRTVAEAARKSRSAYEKTLTRRAARLAMVAA